MRKQRELALDGGQETFTRAREGNEERITLRVDLVAAVGGEGRPQKTLVLG